MSENPEKSKERSKEGERGIIYNLVGGMTRSCVDRELSLDSCPEFRSHYRDSTASAISITELMTVTLLTGDMSPARHTEKSDQIGTQRVYKKTSLNSSLTLYLATRELVSNGSAPAILKGVLYVDPKLIQGCRVYAQLTLTFRYGREDEEVMGLRFCNEAIMSLHQIWPRMEEPSRESLTPLQDALIRRLGDGAFPFTLTLTPQAPPSVQLVPAKKYYGAPIGTSYEVRCFIADKACEKFNRKATVRMSVRIIHRPDAPSNCESEIGSNLPNKHLLPVPDGPSDGSHQSVSPDNHPSSLDETKKSEHRNDAFAKIRISPKNFRFSSRFGRSKSEVEKGPSNVSFNYSKSFHEYDTCSGPEGEVNKPFLLQEGRVSLHANLDKSWYAHGEDVIVTVNIKNESRKTVRKIRVCAIQHVDVCMFNNGKFKNIVADSDDNPIPDQTVGPGSSLSSTFILKPQRGTTKNWIALEDSLQRSSEPDEITGCIAASAIRTPTMCNSIGSGLKGERNVFAIYVSYYVKVKLTLSGMGGELSLKLPFSLIHVDNSSKSTPHVLSPAALSDSTSKQTIDKSPSTPVDKDKDQAIEVAKDTAATNEGRKKQMDHTDCVEEDIQLLQELTVKTSVKRRLVRHENVKDSSEDEDEKDNHARDCPVEVPKPSSSDASSDQQKTTVQIHKTSST